MTSEGTAYRHTHRPVSTFGPGLGRSTLSAVAAPTTVAKGGVSDSRVKNNRVRDAMSYDGNGSGQHQEGYHHQYAYPVHQAYAGHHYLSDGHGEESNFWSSSPRSETPSPGISQSPVVGPYEIYTPISYGNNGEHRGAYRNSYGIGPVNQDIDGRHVVGAPFVRVVKRRSTANKKERRRTQSINNAYADLRDCIPNVPADTKLSKIKTLRLATSYILYLIGVLETDDPAGGFRAELGTMSRKNAAASNGNAAAVATEECATAQAQQKSGAQEEMSGSRRAKGRTGWPQHVWALELKQEHPNGM